MKKIYLSAIALSIASFSFGQSANKAVAMKNVPVTGVTKANTQAQNDKATVLWSNDFSTPADWNTTANVAPDNWVIGTTIPTGAFAIDSINTTNNFALFDSDLMCSGNQDAQVTIANPITVLGSEPAVIVVFDQMYAKFQDSVFVIVSLDNITWTKFEVNKITTNTYPDGGPTTAAPGSNPYSASVNISSVAANQAVVYIGFLFQGGCDYAWMVDNVEIQQAEDNELVLTDPYYGTAAYPYSRIPVAQIQPIEINGYVQNNGGVDQTNTVLTADINSGAFTAASTPQTVAVGTTDSLGTTWTPPVTTGIPYTITINVASDFIDFTPADNTFTFDPIEITDYIYAYDDFGTPGTGGGGNGTAPNENFAFEAGNSFDIWAAADLAAIEVVVGAGTPLNTNFKGVLYERIPAAPFYSKITETKFYVTDASSIGSVTTMLLPARVTLNPNSTYFAAVSTLTEFYYGTSGTSPDGSGTAAQTSLIYYGTMDNPSAQFYSGATPMVRMNFDPTLPVGVEEVNNNVKFNVFPNPSKGIFNINLVSNDANNVNLTVKNVVGQTIISKTVNVSGQTKETISLSDYSKGIYFLTVGNETVKLIVE